VLGSRGVATHDARCNARVGSIATAAARATQRLRSKNVETKSLGYLYPTCSAFLISMKPRTTFGLTAMRDVLGTGAARSGRREGERGGERGAP
jgi:hypothetical protein